MRFIDKKKTLKVVRNINRCNDVTGHCMHMCLLSMANASREGFIESSTIPFAKQKGSIHSRSLFCTLAFPGETKSIEKK